MCSLSLCFFLSLSKKCFVFLRQTRGVARQLTTVGLAMIVCQAACTSDDVNGVFGSESDPLGKTTVALTAPADLTGVGAFGLTVKGDSWMSSDVLVLNLTLTSATPLWAEEIVVYADDKTNGETFRMPWPDLDCRASQAKIDGVVNIAVELPPTFAGSSAIVEVVAHNEQGEQQVAYMTLAPTWLKSLAAGSPVPIAEEQDGQTVANLPVGNNKQIAKQLAAETMGVTP